MKSHSARLQGKGVQQPAAAVLESLGLGGVHKQLRAGAASRQSTFWRRWGCLLLWRDHEDSPEACGDCVCVCRWRGDAA